MSDPIRVFISYASEDFNRVEPLYEKLLEARFEPWIDKKNIVPGEKWEQSIWRAVRRADFFLVCISNKSVSKRGFLQREVRRALTIWREKLEEDIYLIPVRLENCEVPENLSEFQWVNLFEENGFESLVTALYKGTERIRKSHNFEQTSGSGLKIKTETIRDARQEIPRFDIDVQYPQIEGSNDSHINEVNVILKGTVLEEVYNCRKIIFSDNLGEPEESIIPSSSLDGGYNIELFNDTFISVNYSFSTYNYPAAHPNNWVDVCNLYLNPVASITLEDIFKWDSDYLASLTAYCDKDLKRQSIQEYPELDCSVDLASFSYTLREEGRASEEDFSLFTISENALNFIFFGPHALGIWQVSVPLNVIKHTLSKRSPIRQLLK